MNTRQRKDFKGTSAYPVESKSLLEVVPGGGSPGFRERWFSPRRTVRLNSRSGSIVPAVGLLRVLYGCAETSTRMIQANDQYGTAWST